MNVLLGVGHPVPRGHQVLLARGDRLFGTEVVAVEELALDQPGHRLPKHTHGVRSMHGACCEVDEFDEADQTGWSVLVKGRAEDVVEADAVARLARLDIRYWGVGERTHWIRIDPIEVTGRLIGHDVDG